MCIDIANIMRLKFWNYWRFIRYDFGLAIRIYVKDKCHINFNLGTLPSVIWFKNLIIPKFEPDNT